MTPPSRFLEVGQATLTVAKRGLMRSQASARNPDMPPRTECTVLPAIQLYRPDPVVHAFFTPPLISSCVPPHEQTVDCHRRAGAVRLVQYRDTARKRGRVASDTQ